MATSLPLTFAPGTDSSLPTIVPVRCFGCGTEFTRPRSVLWRITPGVPLHCTKACRAAGAAVSLTCEGCGTAYSRMRCDVEKAQRKGFARSFCTKACFLATESREKAALRPCASCGKPRPPGKVRYCSPQCRPGPPLVAVPCEHCGTEFELLRYELAKKRRDGRRVFCSRACVTKAFTSAGCPCLRCGRPTGSTERRRRYCGRECRLAARRDGKPLAACPQCGREFYARSSRQMYCDRVCANDAHSARMTGAGNSRYKDGTSYGLWFRSMRPLIVERDRGICRVCEVPDQMVPTGRGDHFRFKSLLVVHHINEQPWDNLPENLILLCQPCHATHHKSAETPFPWFASYAERATRSMTSKWTETATSLRMRFLSTTA